MGKSTAAALLVERGVKIVDTDLLARQLVERGQPALTEIRETFGSDMFGPDGSLRRDQLARYVFSDVAARKTLENILHPRIRQRWQSQLAEWRSNLPADGTSQPDESIRFFCVVIPLLFETHAETQMDATICLACTPTTQHQRLVSRGWSDEQIAQRISSQLPIEQKMTRANYVAWNEGPLEFLSAQLDRVLRSVADMNHT